MLWAIVVVFVVFLLLLLFKDDALLIYNGVFAIYFDLVISESLHIDEIILEKYVYKFGRSIRLFREKKS